MSIAWLRSICPSPSHRRRNSPQFVSPELVESRTLLTASAAVGVGVHINPTLIGNQLDSTSMLPTNSLQATHSSDSESKTTDVPPAALPPSAIPTFDFSGKWNYNGESINGYIIVNQLNKKADTLLRIGDLEFDMNAKIHGDRLTGKFKKTIPMLKISGKFDVTRVNSTTFLGTLTVNTNGTSKDFLIQGIHV